MTNEAPPTPGPGHQRGPLDHEVRTQIVDAANGYFRHYGYEKTTVSDLAKSIGFSKAYIYKFFDSKQAIGEAICGQCLEGLMAKVTTAVRHGDSASERLRTLFSTILLESLALFFAERKLYDITAHAVTEKWAPPQTYQGEIRALLQQILKEGREQGEFERKTPLDEVSRAIYWAIEPFINPVLLQYRMDDAQDACRDVVGLILRSLAP